MPTPIHNVYLQWMKNELFRMVMAQFLTFDEFEYLELNVATSQYNYYNQNLYSNYVLLILI